jgi:LmeA-like phospholipid-binding
LHHRPSQRGLIRRILQPALSLWLRSQVESLETLQIQIESGDRQVLSGFIPQIELEASQVSYQGLQISQVQLTAQNIQINIGQVLKGKSLRLLETISAQLNVRMSAKDLQRSLSSSLLQTVLIETLLTLVGEQIRDVLGDVSLGDLELQDALLKLSDNQIRFSAQLKANSTGRCVPVALQSGVDLYNAHTIQLCNPEWLPTANSRRGLPLPELNGYRFDLGDQCQLKRLCIQPEEIQLSGQLLISPEI